MKETHDYDDIIDLPHPTSPTHPRMSAIERAAQFSPFAALTGYGDAVKETARLTDSRTELDENRKSVLNEKLQIIADHLGSNEKTGITYFRPDPLKQGGAYVTKIGTVKRIDEISRLVVFTDNTAIGIDDIYEIECGLDVDETPCDN